jgi:hypothetical protein
MHLLGIIWKETLWSLWKCELNVGGYKTIDVVEENTRKYTYVFCFLLLLHHLSNDQEQPHILIGWCGWFECIETETEEQAVYFRHLIHPSCSILPPSHKKLKQYPNPLDEVITIALFRKTKVPNSGSNIVYMRSYYKFSSDFYVVFVKKCLLVYGV